MDVSGKSGSPKRSYNAPLREKAAERTRSRILAAAKRQFEERGWAGATFRAVAADADVSPKTIEATYRTKARLLEATVTFAIRGDVEPVEMLRRSHVQQMEATPTAAEMLERHAAHLRRVNERSARVAFVVEQAAGADPDVRALWERMNRNRLGGVRWATRTLLAKPETDHLRPAHVRSVFLVALDWGTYRVLTGVGGLSARRYQAWLETYYRNMLWPGARNLDSSPSPRRRRA